MEFINSFVKTDYVHIVMCYYRTKYLYNDKVITYLQSVTTGIVSIFKKEKQLGSLTVAYR